MACVGAAGVEERAGVLVELGRGAAWHGVERGLGVAGGLTWSGSSSRARARLPGVNAKERRQSVMWSSAGEPSAKRT